MKALFVTFILTTMGVSQAADVVTFNDPRIGKAWVIANEYDEINPLYPRKPLPNDVIERLRVIRSTAFCKSWGYSHMFGYKIVLQSTKYIHNPVRLAMYIPSKPPKYPKGEWHIHPYTRLDRVYRFSSIDCAK